MALKRCKECGRDVSTKADKCPNCGAPVNRKGTSRGCGCLTILVLTGVTLWAGMKLWQDSPEGRRAAIADRLADAKLRAEAPTLTVPSVVSYYAANEVAGDEALKGKFFKVEGLVDRVGKDILGTSYVAFKSSPDSFRTVQCMFDDAHKDELAALQPGQHIVIFGKCKGLMMNVLLDDCELMPIP